MQLDPDAVDMEALRKIAAPTQTAAIGTAMLTASRNAPPVEEADPERDLSHLSDEEMEMLIYLTMRIRIRADAVMGSGEQEAVGPAFTIRSDKLGNEQGFRFTLRKGADTEGWYTGAWGVSSYTARNLYLNIVPVKMNLPLYNSK